MRRRTVVIFARIEALIQRLFDSSAFVSLRFSLRFFPLTEARRRRPQRGRRSPLCRRGVGASLIRMRFPFLRQPGLCLTRGEHGEGKTYGDRGSHGRYGPSLRSDAIATRGPIMSARLDCTPPLDRCAGQSVCTVRLCVCVCVCVCVCACVCVCVHVCVCMCACRCDHDVFFFF
jgi:hypothetical protein